MDALTQLRKLAFDVTAAPRYRDYVRRYKGKGSPLSKEEWERKVLKKGPSKDAPKSEGKVDKNDRSGTPPSSVKGPGQPDPSAARFLGLSAVTEGLAKKVEKGTATKEDVADALSKAESMLARREKSNPGESIVNVLKTRVNFLKKMDKAFGGSPKGDSGSKSKAKSYKKKYAPAVTQVMDKHSLTDKDADEVRAFKNQKPWQGQKISDAEKLRRFLAKAKPETKERMKGVSPAEFVKMLGAILDDEDGGGKQAGLDPMTRLRELHTACGCGDEQMAGRKWNGTPGKVYDRKPYYPGKRKEIGEEPLAGEPGSEQRKLYNKWWRNNFWNAKTADALTALADLDDETVDGILSEILFDGEFAGRKWNGTPGKVYDRKPYYPGKRKEIGEEPLAGEPGSEQRKLYNKWWRNNFWNEKEASNEPMARLALMAVESSQVGRTILDQMGGARRLMMMLGVKQFITMPNGVQFKWPNRQRSKGNMVKITLRGDDTYDMEFLNAAGYDAKTVKKHQGVYAEDLVNLFEKQTGWYLRLGRDTSEAIITAAFGVEADWQTGMRDDKPVTGPDAREGEGSDVPDGDGNVAKRAAGTLKWDHDAKDKQGRGIWKAKSPNGDGDYEVWEDSNGKLHWTLKKPGSSSGLASPSTFRSWERAAKDAEAHAAKSGRWKGRSATHIHMRERTKAAASMDIYVAVSGNKLYGATDSKSGASKSGWSKVNRTKKVNSFNIVKLTNVPESLAAKLVDFGADNPKTSAWNSESEAYKAAEKYMPNGKKGHLPVEDPYETKPQDSGGMSAPPQSKAAATGPYGFPKKLAGDCDAASRRVAKAATEIAKRVYAKDARVAEFLQAHAERGKSLSAKALVAALSEMGPKVASDKTAAERLQELREANGFAEKTAANNGKNNKSYLDSLPAPQRDNILKEIAKHYGISSKDAYDEVIDRDAEKLYEYLAANRSLAMVVYGDFRNFRFATDKEAMTPFERNQNAMKEEAGGRLKREWNPEKLAKLIVKMKSFRNMVGRSRDMVKDALIALEEAGEIRRFDDDMFFMLRDAVERLMGWKSASTDRDRLAVSKEAKYGLYGYRAKTSKLGLDACSELRHEAGAIASDLHRRRHDKHARINEYLTTHCKEAGCNYSQMLLDGYPSADMKFASVPAPSTIDEWLAWED